MRTGLPARTGVRSVRALLCAGICTAALVLAGCSGPSGGAGDGGREGTEAKNGDSAPASGAGGGADGARRSVPRGKGSRIPDDFNGDGHRDLVLNDLVKSPDDPYGDDAGIGIVYGTAGPRALDPAVRQTLSAHEQGARVDGALPAAFDAEAACDLDQDGYGDLIITTDPPYDGIGVPPVPLQILFGGPTGLGSGGNGKAVVLKIPAKARAGNEWPDHPVCGDFDGDGAVDLAVTASAGQISYLRGPFSRSGAPRGAAAPIPDGGAALAAPEPKADVDGDGYDDLVHSPRAHVPGKADKGTLLRGGPDGPARAGGPYRFRAVRLPAPPELPSRSRTETPRTGKVTTVLLRSADFDGDKRPDVVTRTHRGETEDLIALYGTRTGGSSAGDADTGGKGADGGGTGGGDAGADGAKSAVSDRPLITFSTSIFLG
ncbi:FG-GAP repeat domain-containing protein [Streptomyces hebeiensis]